MDLKDREIKMWYLTCCVVSLALGLVVILIRKWHRQAKRKCISSSCFGDLIACSSTLVSRQHPHGRFLTVLMFALNMTSLVFYLILTTRPVEYRVETLDGLLLADLCLELLHLIHMVIRLMAAQDLMATWLHYKTIADLFTVAPAFFTLITGRAWLGCRFIRALYILELPAILRTLNIVTSETSLRLCRFAAVLLGTLFSYAGLIHLVENSGDPWVEHVNITSRPYFLFVYFLTVTMSTVGYGDVLVYSASGQLLMTAFIFIFLGMFARFIPQMMDIITNRKRFTGKYTISGKLHVVVCGHLSITNIEHFVKEFYHKDRGTVNTTLLFLGDFCPDVNLEYYLSSIPGIRFYQGSVLIKEDQKRVMMHTASACVILCNRFSADPDAEDAVTLMNVIAIKTFNPKTRVIVQMLKPNSKVMVQNISGWNWTSGDAALCPNELKLGFMAQSCRVPGLSSMLAHLFTMQSKVEDKTCLSIESLMGFSDLGADNHYIPQTGDSWENLYRQGMYNEIYTEHLSWSFIEMSFAQASKLCFLRLGLLLIGIAMVNEDNEMSVLVNPPTCVRIKRGTIGFLVASEASDARRASIFCERCHGKVDNPSRMRPCQCPDFNDDGSQTSDVSLPRPSLGVLPMNADPEEDGHWTQELEMEGPVMLDSTGMFHWCPPVSLEQVTLTREDARNLDLQRHVVVCVFGDGSSRQPGLRAFMMPLRSSSLTRPELLTVVFLGDRDIILREWAQIHYFPNIFFLPGSPVCLEDLRVAGVTRCLRTVMLNSTDDTQTLLACSTLNRLSLQSAQTAIPLLVELDNTRNVQFLNDTNRPEEADSFPLTEAFSVGKVFSVEVLDSLMAATYFNSNVPLLVSTLVTGGDTPLLESQLSQDNQLKEGVMTPQLRALRRRSKLAQLSLQDHPLCRLQQCVLYKDLFVQVLDTMEILCFGLYRLIDPPNAAMKRFVISNPDADLPLLDSDRVFCSVPFHQSHLLTQST